MKEGETGIKKKKECCVYDDDGVYLILVQGVGGVYLYEGITDTKSSCLGFDHAVRLLVCLFIIVLSVQSLAAYICFSPPFFSTAFWLEIPLICILLWINDGWMDHLTWLPLSTRSCLLCR